MDIVRERRYALEYLRTGPKYPSSIKDQGVEIGVDILIREGAARMRKPLGGLGGDFVELTPPLLVSPSGIGHHRSKGSGEPLCGIDRLPTWAEKWTARRHCHRCLRSTLPSLEGAKQCE